MKLLKLAAIAALAHSGVSFAIGAPQKYSNCPSKVKISNPKDSVGHFFSRDCSTVYVLPPKTSDFEVIGLNSMMTQPICSAIDSMQRQFLSEMISLEEMIDEFGFDKSQYKKLMKEVNQNKSAINKYNGYKATYDVALQQYQDLILSLNTELEALELNPKGYSDALLKIKISKLERKIKDAKEKRSEVEIALAKINAALVSFTANIQDAESKITVMFEDRPEIADKRALIDDAIQTFVEDYGSKKGADASVAFISKHSDLVEEFRVLNKDSGVGFIEMPTKQAFTFTVKGLGGLELPGTVSVAVKGVMAGFANDPSQGDAMHFGASLGGQIELSQIAACAISGGQQGLDPEELKRRASAVIVGNVFFEYNPQVHYGYEAKYNKAEMFRRIVETKTKGGFFSTKSLREIRESAEFNQNFQIEIFEEEAGLIPDMSALREEVKSQIFDDAIKDITKAHGLFAGKDISGMPEAPKAAAPILADGLRKCPHLYCQVGAIVVDFAHALFGSQSSKDDFLRQIDYVTTEKVDAFTPVQLYGSYTFLPKREE